MAKRQCETAKFPITRMESRCKSFKGQKTRVRVKHPRKRTYINRMNKLANHYSGVNASKRRHVLKRFHK